MRLEEYTADAICRAMGLDAFEPDGPSCVRVLLMPSFHPEVCVTVAGGGDGDRARLSVVVLTDMLWRQPAPRRLPELREEASVPAEVFAEAAAGLTAAFAERHRDRRVCLDGMRVECGLLDAGRTDRFAEHVYRPAVSEFVGRLVWLAWIACQVPGVRNALAACARYLSAEYPRQPDPERSDGRLMVLGAPEARGEFFEAFRRRGGPTEPEVPTSPPN